MRTKEIQARHLHVSMEIVDGGDGTKRTTHRINELSASPLGVLAVVRKGEGFDRRTFNPKDPVRIKDGD